MTYGEIMVGSAFNPSGDSDVAYVKNEFAKMINLAESVVNDKLQEVSQEMGDGDNEVINLKGDVAVNVYEMTLKSLLEAQMMLVKLITLPIK